jgi:ABC-type Fe3+/spermidine/putrescine transport system ATPase subunit
MISIEHLSARFGSFKLDDISLEVGSGRTLVVLGPSGAGKTLLLETIMGVRRPEAGRVSIDGRDLLGLPPEERRISYIPQDLALFPHLSVRDNILFGLRARSRAGGQATVLFDMLVERLGLAPVVDRREVLNLSGGERQRVAIARALIIEPRVLFLDEPFSALDRVSRLEALMTLRLVKQELGTTIVLVTHDLEEASALGDDLAILMAGQLVQRGTRDEVLLRPRSRSVASFLLVKNILPAAALPLVLREGARESRWLAIRPEEIVLLEGADGRPNCFPARVLDTVLLASRWGIELALSGPTGDVRVEAALQPGRFRVLQPTVGRELVAHLPPEGIVSLDE